MNNKLQQLVVLPPGLSQAQFQMSLDGQDELETKDV